MNGILLITAVTLSFCIGLPSRHERAEPAFSQSHSEGHVDTSDLDEASGLAASRKFPGTLYTHNDHGDSARIFVLTTHGANLQTILHISSPATNHDWEDIAVGPCGSNSTDDCIYIADTGDAKPGAANVIYRIREPTSLTPAVQTVLPDGVLKFTWNEEDCETLLVDPDGELYIIAKVHGGRGTIAHLPSNAWNNPNPVHVTSSAKLQITTSHNDPRGGDISPNGDEVLIKTDKDIYYWSVSGRDYVNVLSTQNGVEMPYHVEHQGEAVCWSAHGQKYYTLGEGHHETLYSYSRQNGAQTVG